MDILIEQGATFERVLTLRDANDAPINLTGFTFTGQIRKKYSDAVSLAAFTFQILEQGTTTGQVRMSLSSATTDALPVDKAESAEKKLTSYVYDVEMNTGSRIDRILEGLANVSPQVTRA